MRDHAERRSQPERGRERHGSEDRCRRECDRDGQRTGRNRPVPFDRMAAIRLAIGDVIDEIDDTGKRCRTPRRPPSGVEDGVHVLQPLAEQQGRRR